MARENRATLESDSSYAPPRSMLALVLLRRGRGDEAIAEARKAMANSDNSFGLMCLGYIYGRLGKTHEAVAALRELRSRPEGFSQNSLACVYNGLGDRNRTLELLEKSVESKEEEMCWLKTDPMYDPFRSDARFQALLARVYPPAVTP